MSGEVLDAKSPVPVQGEREVWAHPVRTYVASPPAAPQEVRIVVEHAPAQVGEERREAPGWLRVIALAICIGAAIVVTVFVLSISGREAASPPWQDTTTQHRERSR